MIVFHAPHALHEDFFPLIVMDAVLSGAKGMGIFGGGTNNRSNRLYKALVASQLTVGAGSSFRPTIDPSTFTFYATLAPEVTHQQVEEAIWAEIAKIQEAGVTDVEVAKAIKQTKAQFAYSNESVTHQASDVQRVAQTYFDYSKQTVGCYMPATGA